MSFDYGKPKLKKVAYWRGARIELRIANMIPAEGWYDIYVYGEDPQGEHDYFSECKAGSRVPWILSRWGFDYDVMVWHEKPDGVITPYVPLNSSGGSAGHSVETPDRVTGRDGRSYLSQHSDTASYQWSVYFIQEREDGPIKIGIAINVEKRLAGLQSANSRTLRLLATMPGTVKEEAELHHRFKHLHIRGEWFRPEADLLDFISMLNNTD